MFGRSLSIWTIALLFAIAIATPLRNEQRTSAAGKEIATTFNERGLTTRAGAWTWNVSVSFNAATVAVWIGCATYLPAQAYSGCFAAAILSLLTATISSAGTFGSATSSVSTTKRSIDDGHDDVTADMLDPMAQAYNNVLDSSYTHITPYGNYSGLNHSALTDEWQTVVLSNAHYNLLAKRGSGNDTVLKTDGYLINGLLPGQEVAENSTLATRASGYIISDLIMYWNADKGFGNRGTKAAGPAVTAAAKYLDTAPVGSYGFCNTIKSPGGLYMDASITFQSSGFSGVEGFPCYA